MKKIFFVLLATVITGNKTMANEFKETQHPEAIIRLIHRVEKVKGKSSQNKLVKNWLKEHQNLNFPLVQEKQVTFLYFKESKRKAKKVSLALEANNYDKSALFLKRVAESDLFVLTLKFDSSDRISYRYYIWANGKPRRTSDPFNFAVSMEKPGMNLVSTPDAAHGTVYRLPSHRPKTSIIRLRKRYLWVYLPEAYQLHPEKHYPVLYLMDGQNLWSAKNMPYGGWKVDKAADRLIHEKKIEPIIIVGIENSFDRAQEYVGFSLLYGFDKEKWYPKIKQAETIKKAPLQSKAFVDYVIHEVKPLIDKTYRTLSNRANTAIGGSSFGAGVSLHIAFSHPKVFSKIASLSGGNYPSTHSRFYIVPFAVFPYLIEKELPQPIFDIYMGCGDKGVDQVFLPQTRKLHQALLKKGWKKGKNLFYYEDPGKNHNEAAWAARVPEMLEYFYGI